ncbi:hypothetical protein VOLCADRAFT_91899 [Volvox carteri f. nagariensis]|uniref:Protein kinase domain-containing protein n=1 Tax=Volvox carteri f. nagariensis TaxID=3068 RepID=D8TY89_VOLCA|nr:uncharacterized protein VOLCADRAFT_91899 [Volvox carteri f. nagariensis]EFJ47601.1 hypothetical protein VOLCADRAFT_91899 [Volvox carteri f. nagariensis]|eukprot:XP_002951425.1 hypothetical protein VOLCADRAFT_91899 [Volvox carteri f. nagariensis]
MYTPGEDEPLNAGSANQPEVLAETLLQRRRVLTRAALELALMSSISHPNIVYAQWPTALLERDETQPCRRRLRKLPPDTPPPISGGLVCAVMVMEYCDKGTLVDAINRDGRRSVVTDEACGTVTHMAPESFVEGEPVDSSADVYAFGILMWELISGKQPYHDRNLKQLPHEVVNKGLRPTFPPNTPDVYKSLAKSCWNPLPRNRPTAAQVAVLRLGRRWQQMTNQGQSPKAAAAAAVPERYRDVLRGARGSLLKKKLATASVVMVLVVVMVLMVLVVVMVLRSSAERMVLGAVLAMGRPPSAASFCDGKKRSGGAKGPPWTASIAAGRMFVCCSHPSQACYGGLVIAGGSCRPRARLLGPAVAITIITNVALFY